MRRQSEPARELPSHVAAPHAAALGGHWRTGAHAHEAGDAVPLEASLALAAGSERDVATRLAVDPERRDPRGFWLRRKRDLQRARRLAPAHSALAGGAAWLEPPASPVYLVPDTPEFAEDAPSSTLAFAVKRAVDVVGALIGLLLAAPLLATLAVLVRLDSEGPALFGHARVGRGGRVFRCYKLRTMRQDAESLLRTDLELRATYERNGFKVPYAADRRITRLGRLLRLTSCDELPQLWNVLRGEMSLVGPRPLVVRELAHYPGADRDVLLSVRPGLTGAWAVGGRSRIGYPERARLELDYVRGWTPRRDLGILLRTVGVVLARHGAS